MGLRSQSVLTMYFRTLPADHRGPFPFLTDSNHMVTSIETDNYNCAAWAVGVTNRPWWPARRGESPYVYEWPIGCRREATIDTFVCAFGGLGFDVCGDGALEPAYEKIAIYADAFDRPKHVARQLPNGLWSSKLGFWEDIAHADLFTVRGGGYGSATVFMRRPRASQEAN
jgi:hypothetical protein